jgi:hypothetical protein
LTHGEFRAHVKRLGYILDSFLRVKSETASKAVATRLTTEAIQEAIAGACRQTSTKIVSFVERAPLAQRAIIEVVITSTYANL